jgi:IS30 family transposase
MKKVTHLTAVERDMIGFYLSSGQSIRSIATTLGRSKTTISDEINRNCVNGIYLPIHAHQKSNERLHAANRKNPRKDDLVWAYVVRMLRKKWSPELISGRLKFVLYQEDQTKWISAECIYARIYERENTGKRLWAHLPRKHHKRKSKHCGRRGHIIHDRVSIHERPEVINTRLEFGHWEGDSVVSKGRKSGVHTEVERKTRLLLVKKVSRLTGQKSVNAQIQLFKKLPEEARKSTTLDNGSENTKHNQLHRLNMKTYFADPYSSCQRGSNEWHNGLLRRYFPKGTDFATIRQARIQRAQDQINSRPRKVLVFKTPKEVFKENLNLLSGRIRSGM